MKGKTVIVTGAGSGIGKATAELFAKEGAAVVLSDIMETAGEAAAANIRLAGGQAIFFKANVAQPKEMEALVNFAMITYGKLDIAVNNAGIGGERNPVGDMSIEGFQNVIHYIHEN